MKDKNHTTISADAEKAFDKIPLFIYKSSVDWLQKQHNINIIKAAYNKPIRNIILGGEKWKVLFYDEEHEGCSYLHSPLCVCFGYLWDLSSSPKDRTWVFFPTLHSERAKS